MSIIWQINSQVNQTGLSFVMILICLSCSVPKKYCSDLDRIYFNVEVIQDDKILKKGDDNIVKLEKKPFKFKFSLIRTNRISLYSSWIDLSDKDREMMEIYGGDRTQIGTTFSSTTGTFDIDYFTPTKTICVGNNLGDQTIYFYDKTIDLNRLDKEKVNKKDVRYSELEFENIYDDDKRIRYKAEELNNDIYVEFVAGKSEGLQKEKIILEFK